jgi:hypothetical protein
MDRVSRMRPAPRRTALTVLGFATLVLCACASAPPPPPLATVDDSGVYRRAEAERTRALEREVERLRADLRQAEEAVLTLESGMLGERTRADAVTATAAAKVQLTRARDRAPWCVAQLESAQRKLEEAERQAEHGHVGAAIFFASRAQRIADQALEQAQDSERTEGARRIHGSRVNLREGPGKDATVEAVLLGGTPVFPERAENDWLLVRTPGGRVGWVHASLVR